MSLVSNTCLAISYCCTPAASSSAASRWVSGVVDWYWKRPVSVTRAVYRSVAIWRSIGRSRRRSSSRQSTALAGAAGSIRFTSPKRVLEAWWSITSVRRAPWNALTRLPRRSSEPVSKHTNRSAERGACRLPLVCLDAHGFLSVGLLRLLWPLTEIGQELVDSRGTRRDVVGDEF